jgi:hypothetical protein
MAHPTSSRGPAMLAALEASKDFAGVPIGSTDMRATFVIEFATWCQPCTEELALLHDARDRHSNVRWIGVSYKPHEEYDQRGGAPQVAAFVSATPWLRVVPMDDALYTSLDRPRKIPMLWVFDANGTLVAKFSQQPPDASELESLFTRLGG